jgi:ABC-2 type transport system ATP-binding protein
VSHLGIIHQGRLKFQGTWSELQALQKAQQAVVWRTSDLTATLDIVGNGKVTHHGIICPWMSEQDVARVNRQIIEASIELFEVRYLTPDLESIFLQMIQNA